MLTGVANSVVDLDVGVTVAGIDVLKPGSIVVPWVKVGEGSIPVCGVDATGAGEVGDGAGKLIGVAVGSTTPEEGGRSVGKGVGVAVGASFVGEGRVGGDWVGAKVQIWSNATTGGGSPWPHFQPSTFP